MGILLLLLLLLLKVIITHTPELQVPFWVIENLQFVPSANFKPLMQCPVMQIPEIKHSPGLQNELSGTLVQFSRRDSSEAVVERDDLDEISDVDSK